MDHRKREMVHRVLGECYMTEQTMLLDAKNPDRTTTFVELADGEIKEVEISMISCTNK